MRIKSFVWKTLVVALVAPLSIANSDADASETLKRYLPLSSELDTLNTCKNDFLETEYDGFGYSTYIDARQEITAPKTVTISTYFTQNCFSKENYYRLRLEWIRENGELQTLNTTYEYSLEKDDYAYYDDPSECGRFVSSCWSYWKDYSISFQTSPGTNTQTTESVGLRITVEYDEYTCEYEEDRGAGQVQICKYVPQSRSQDIDNFLVVTFPPNPVQQPQEMPEGQQTEPEVADPSSTKLNAGSFKGYVAMYVKGYAGKKFSAKVGNDWVIIDRIESDFERYVEFTGAGYTIDVRMYIDRVLTETIRVTTK